MKPISLLTLTLAASLFTACGAPAGNNAATANTANAINAANANSAKPAAAAAPTREALMALERSGWEAWKNRDAKWTEENYSDKGFNVGSTGRTEKAEMIKAFTTQKCEIKSFSLSDDHMQMAGSDVAILTFHAAQDAVCDGATNAANVRSASIYIRESDKWKAVFYAEAPIVDPKAPPATVQRQETKKAETKVGTRITTQDGKPLDEYGQPLRKDTSKPAAPDALTQALGPAEKAVWEAWKDQDGKRIEGLITNEISFINIFGTYFPTRADAVKDWTSHGCEVKSVSITDPVATMLSPTTGILTFTGGADGTCFGQKIGPIRGTSVYVKEDNAWKWAFGINIPAG